MSHKPALRCWWRRHGRRPVRQERFHSPHLPTDCAVWLSQQRLFQTNHQCRYGSSQLLHMAQFLEPESSSTRDHTSGFQAVNQFSQPLRRYQSLGPVDRRQRLRFPHGHQSIFGRSIDRLDDPERATKLSPRLPDLSAASWHDADLPVHASIRPVLPRRSESHIVRRRFQLSRPEVDRRIRGRRCGASDGHYDSQSKPIRHQSQHRRTIHVTPPHQPTHTTRRLLDKLWHVSLEQWNQYVYSNGCYMLSVSIHSYRLRHSHGRLCSELRQLPGLVNERQTVPDGSWIRSDRQPHFRRLWAVAVRNSDKLWQWHMYVDWKSESSCRRQLRSDPFRQRSSACIGCQ